MFPPARLLVGVDFSESSRTALAVAARLARHGGSHLCVLHALDPRLSTAASGVGVDLAHETRDELDAFIASTPHVTDGPHDALVVTGQAADVICRIAEREGVGLTVVGTHGMSGATRPFVGSVTARVLQGTRTSILIVPSRWAPPDEDMPDCQGIGGIIAALDFTDAAMSAARTAFEGAASLHTSLELLHVVPALPVIPRWSRHAARATDDRTAAAERQLATLATQFANGVPLRTSIERGPIPDVLAAAIARQRGRTPILMLGRHAPGGDVLPSGAILAHLLPAVDALILVSVAHAGSD